jgi:hypothetical protein
VPRWRDGTIDRARGVRAAEHGDAAIGEADEVVADPRSIQDAKDFDVVEAPVFEAAWCAPADADADMVIRERGEP